MTIKYLDSKRISVLSSSCLVRFTLDESSGNPTNHATTANGFPLGTGSTNDGTNGSSGATQNVTGKFDKCFEFDSGNNKQVNIGTVLSGTGDFSISLWINLTSNNTGYPSVVSNYGGSNTGGYQFLLWGANTISFHTTGSAIHGATVMTTSAWHHVVATRTSGVLDLYVDGSSDATSVANTHSITTSLSDAIGGKSDGTSGFNGKIDEVTFHNKGLTSSEVSALWYSGTGKVTEGSRPPNVQDNSILVEKDTGKRYWFDEATAPTYSGDLGTWATDGTQVTESSDVVTMNIQTRVTNNTVTNDLGSALSNSAWVMRCKLILSTITGGGSSTVYLELGVGSASASTGIDNGGVTQDFIGLQQRKSNTTDGWGLVGYNSTGGLDNPESPEMDTDPTTRTYYVEIKRLSTTSMSIGLYDSADYNTLISGLPIETKTISDQVIGLQYIRVGNGMVSSESSTGNVIAGTVQDIEIYNAVTSATPATWTKETSSVPTVAGLQLHLDASDASTITKDGSNLVSAWNDKSGQANHVVQATGSKQPLWVDQVQDTLPTIRFDGSSDEMKVTYGSALSTSATVFVVGTMPTHSSGVERFVFDGLTSGGRFAYLITSSTPYLHYMYRGNGLTSTNIDKTMRMFTLVYNSTSSSLGIDGTDVATGNAGTDSPTGLTLGAGYSAGASFGDVDICEILIYGSALSTADRTSIENYLSNKWSTP